MKKCCNYCATLTLVRMKKTLFEETGGRLKEETEGKGGDKGGGREMEGVDQSFRGRSGGLRPIS